MASSAGDSGLKRPPRRLGQLPRAATNFGKHYPQKPASQPFVPLSPASLGNLAAGSFFGQDQAALHMVLVCVHALRFTKASRDFSTQSELSNCGSLVSLASSGNSVLGLLKFVYSIFDD
ncbi:hypothetical protein QLX08_003698 [Tetragonisca angustula]|uniref:Uncharacterized protein n=1 Tax=Tetragonisca angustula TaxID=166442 RepID=A0AAW1A5M4_9HYME